MIQVEENNKENPITAKPIFTIGFPRGYKPSYISSITQGIISKLQDYHVICYSGMKDDFEFNAFHPKDFDGVSLAQVTSLVHSEIKDTTRELNEAEAEQINKKLSEMCQCDRVSFLRALTGLDDITING